MKKKILLFVGVVIVIALIIWGTAGRGDIATKGKIKVGVIAPLSGQYAVLGENVKKSILMAADGDKNIELIFEDSQFDPKRAVSAYQKLTSIDKIDALINLDSPSLASMQSLIDKDNLLTFHLTESNEKKNDTVFQIVPFSYPIFGAIGKEAGTRYRKIALVYGNLDVFITDAQYFKEQAGTDKIISETKIADNKDLRSEVTKILSNNPDAVTVMVDKDTGVMMLKEIKKQKGTRKVDVICDANMEFMIDDYIKGVGFEMLDGCISANLPDMKESFKVMFKEKYGSEPTVLSDIAFDSVKIIQKLEEEPKDKWVNLVSKTNMEGVSGQIKLDDTGTRLAAYVMKVFKDGKFVELK